MNGTEASHPLIPTLQRTYNHAALEHLGESLFDNAGADASAAVAISVAVCASHLAICIDRKGPVKILSGYVRCWCGSKDCDCDTV